MRSFTVFNETSGEVLRYGMCSDTDFELQARAGEVCVEGIAPKNTYRVRGEWVSRPEQPSPRHVWSGGKWVDPRTPAQIRDEAWQTVRYRRDQLLRQTDWEVLRALEAKAAVPPAMRAYRQALRDITQQPDPLNIVWPAAPG